MAGGSKGIGSLRRREGDAVVSPEISQPLARKRIVEGTIVLVEFMNGQQLNRCHSKPFQIWNLLDQTGECTRFRDARGWMAGETANVKFIDDAVFPRNKRRLVFFPIESRSARDDATSRG